MGYELVKLIFGSPIGYHQQVQFWVVFTILFRGFVTGFGLDALTFSLFLEVGFFDFRGAFFVTVPSFFKFFDLLLCAIDSYNNFRPACKISSHILKQRQSYDHFRFATFEKFDPEKALKRSKNTQKGLFLGYFSPDSIDFRIFLLKIYFFVFCSELVLQWIVFC